MNTKVNWKEKLGLWQSWLLVAFVFFLPISSAAPNLILLVILVLWLVEADFARKWSQMKVHPIFFPMLAFALIYPVSLLWTEDMAWGQHMVERHAIYLLFPLLLTVVRREHIAYYLSAFVLAMTISETASYLVWFHLITVPGIDPLDPAGFMGHWEYNPFLALAIYWMGHSLLFGQPKQWQKWVFGLFIVTMSINMFITGGRIGQIAYFVLLLLLFGQYFASKGVLWRGLSVAAAGLAAVFVLAYSSSDLFQTRVDRAIHEVQTHDNTKTGSVNARFIFWQNTLGMIAERPLLGSGIGDFPQDYNAFVGDDAPIHMSTFGEGGGHSQPHNQYLFELASFGLLGGLVFVWLFASLVRIALQRQGEWWRLRQAFVLLTLVIMLTDSYLLVQAFSYLFVVMVAMLWTQSDKAQR
jgi:O-antigen ligase